MRSVERAFTEWVGSDGFEPPQPKAWPAGDEPPLHHHEFDARVLVTEGELVMVYADRSETLVAGDRCDVPAGTMHSEQASSSGASGLLAVRRAEPAPS